MKNRATLMRAALATVIGLVTATSGCRCDHGSGEAGAPDSVAAPNAGSLAQDGSTPVNQQSQVESNK